MRSPLSPLAVAAALAARVLAQQYAGDVINNTLPTLNGAAINFFKIPDTTSKAGGYATLMNYYSAPNGNRLIESQVQRAIIVVHGLDEDPWVYWSATAVALQNAKAVNPAINESTVAIMAPYFANGDGKNTGYPWTDGLKANKGSTSSALVWSGSNWASGAANQYPWNHASISSYTVLDEIIKYYNNAALYPNLKHIVIAGHSLGGQTVHRYAAVGNQLGTRIPMTYWAGNPDSFAWLNSSRPIWPSTCTMYDDWRYGLSNYGNDYASGLVAAGPAAVEANFRTRRFVFARGLQDFGQDSSTCAPISQGANRGTRFFNFLSYFPPRSPQLVDYFPNVGHDAPTIFASPAGIQRFYLDNWDGSGNYAPDAGPRMIKGDDPSPDPNYKKLWGKYPGPFGTVDTPQPTPSPVAKVTPTGAAPQPTYTYAGCYSDSNARAITNNIWSGNANASVETCVGACAARGYTVAGLESGTDCWCDKQIQNGATLQNDTSCYTPCQGNLGEFCGGSWLLSVYNTGPLTVYTGPHVVPSVGAYNSIGCWTDQGGARTLSAKVPALGAANSIEACAAACKGYSYFGTEYGQECYCDNVMGAASTKAALSSCAMPCAANASETCGAGNFLNIYQYNGTAPIAGTTSITSSLSTSAASTSTSAASTTTSTTTTVSSTSSSSATSTPSPIAGLKYQGCYLDSATTRTLGFFAGANGNTMAPTLCSSLCTDAGYTYAGIEYGDECYCGNTLAIGSLEPDSDCSMPCAGDPTIHCGASWRLSVYSVAAGVSSVSSASTTAISSTAVSSTSSTSTSTSASVSSISSTISASSSASLSSTSVSSTVSASSTVPSTSVTSTSASKSTTSSSSGTASTSTVPKSSSSTTTVTSTSTVPASTSVLTSTASTTTSSLTSSTAKTSSTASGSSTTASTSASTSSSTATSSLASSTSSSSSSTAKASSTTVSSTTSTISSTPVSSSTSASSSAIVSSSSSTTSSSAISSSATTTSSMTTTSSSVTTTSTKPSSSTVTSSSTPASSSTSAASSTTARSSTSTTSSTASSTSATAATSTTASSSTVSSTAATTSTRSSSSTVPSSSTPASSSTSTASSTTARSSTTTTTPSSSSASSSTVASSSIVPSSSTVQSSSTTATSSKATTSSTTTASSSTVASSTASTSSATTTKASSTTVSTSTTTSTVTSSSSSTSTSSLASSTSSTRSTTASSSTVTPSSTATSISASTVSSTATSISTTASSSAVTSTSTASASSTTTRSSTTLSSSATTSTSSATSSPLSPTSSTIKSSTATSSSTSVSVSSVPVTSTATATTISASTSSSSSSAVPTSSSTSVSKYMGCYVDSTPRMLEYFAGTSSSMTPKSCSSLCSAAGFTYAGVEYGDECYCGNKLGAMAINPECTMPCAGDSNIMCGAGWRLSVYTAVSTSVTVKSVGNWNSIGCWTDAVSTRALSAAAPSLGANNTVEACAAACAGHNFFGVEYGTECYCGSAVAKTSTLAAATDCSMTCSGNPSEFCGAGNRINVYQNSQATRRRRGMSFW